MSTQERTEQVRLETVNKASELLTELEGLPEDEVKGVVNKLTGIIIGMKMSDGQKKNA